MTLDFDKLVDITQGAAYIDAQDGFFSFHRFTREQEEFYKERSADFYKKTLATSGVKLSFETDSERLTLKGTVSSGSSRTFYAADFFVNGKFLSSVNNFDGVSLPKDYTKVTLPLEPFAKTFDLGKGQKTVSLYLPWSVNMRFSELSIDDGATIVPVKSAKTLVAFGDSITHGYDALHPSNKYATRVAELLQAQEYNKGIGAEIFCPALAGFKEYFTPDYISVAYGTNDWSKSSGEDFERNCKGFLTTLCNNYPTSKVFVISPIWRKDCGATTQCGVFGNIEKYLRSVVDGIENARLIPGFDLVPHSEDFYSDLRLHPNDEGFLKYADALKSVILQ